MRHVQLVLFLALVFSSSPVRARPDVREGDIVFQTSGSAQSDAIQAATDSPFSHVGIVIDRGQGLFVFEASARVEYTPLEEWLASGRNGRYQIMRLKDAAPLARESAIARLHAAADELVGRPYDTRFQWSNERIYCSELVWKIYKSAWNIDLCSPRKFSSYRLDHPKVRPLVRKRFGSKVPRDEPAVAPGDLARSELLEIVDRR